MDPTKMTRVRAEKMVAATNDPELLGKLADHKNSHVRAKVRFKLLSAEDRARFKLLSPADRRAATADFRVALSKIEIAS